MEDVLDLTAILLENHREKLDHLATERMRLMMLNQEACRAQRQEQSALLRRMDATARTICRLEPVERLFVREYARAYLEPLEKMCAMLQGTYRSPREFAMAASALYELQWGVCPQEEVLDAFGEDLYEASLRGYLVQNLDGSMEVFGPIIAAKEE